MRRPDPAIGAVLLFGPDRGLVRERSRQLTAAVLGPTADPFRLIDIGTAEVRAAPASLADAARSFPLVPGRQVLRVRDGVDTIAEAVRLLLQSENWEALVIIEAGDLGKRSALRELCEASKVAAAIACYADDDAALRQVIEETLSDHGLSASGAAMDLLNGMLGADRGLTRQELRKLATYCGDSGHVGVADVLAVVGDAGSISLGELALAAASGDADGLNRLLAAAAERGLEPIGVLRATQQHLQRLHRGQAELLRGRTVREAVQALRPPVFFRDIDEYARQIRQWRPAALEAALILLIKAERACKRTGAPQGAIAMRAVLEVAKLARSG